MLEKIYNLFGKIFENAQYIEWNLALILCKSCEKNVKDLFEDMQSMTMGEIIGCAKKIKIFEKKDIEKLENILKKRNYLAHLFFKKNDLEKNINNDKFLDNKVGELKNLLSCFENFNNYLSEICKEIPD